jgi:hypothetical protein
MDSFLSAIDNVAVAMSGSLGYVFWHWPMKGVRKESYERKLVGFQDSLRSHPPKGFVDALSFRVNPMPWSSPSPKGYEDWYLVEDFGSLGVLNDAAVATANRGSHDGVAAMAAGVAGGIYKLHWSKLGLRYAQFATWFRKPSGMTYETLYDSLAELLGDRRTDLWRRQMVLGPTPEFCVHSERRVKLPSAFEALVTNVDPLRSRP